MIDGAGLCIPRRGRRDAWGGRCAGRRRRDRARTHSGRGGTRSRRAGPSPRRSRRPSDTARSGAGRRTPPGRRRHGTPPDSGTGPRRHLPVSRRSRRDRRPTTNSLRSAHTRRRLFLQTDHPAAAAAAFCHSYPPSISCR